MATISSTLRQCFRSDFLPLWPKNWYQGKEKRTQDRGLGGGKTHTKHCSALSPLHSPVSKCLILWGLRRDRRDYTTWCWFFFIWLQLTTGKSKMTVSPTLWWVFMSQSHSGLGGGEEREATRWPPPRLPEDWLVLGLNPLEAPDTPCWPLSRCDWGPMTILHLALIKATPAKKTKLYYHPQKGIRKKEKEWREEQVVEKSSKNWNQSPKAAQEMTLLCLWELINVARNQVQEALEKCTQSLRLCVMAVCCPFVKKRRGQKNALFDRQELSAMGREIVLSNHSLWEHCRSMSPNAMMPDATDGHLNYHSLQPQTTSTSMVKLTWKHHLAKNHFSCF